MMQGTNQSPADRVGTTVGKYKLLDVLREDPLAFVYLAEKPGQTRRIELRLLRPELASDPASVLRFFAVAHAQDKLRDEHIVRVVDSIEDPSGDNAVCTELLYGETLTTLLDREGPLPIERGLNIVRQIAEAQAAVQASGAFAGELQADDVFLADRGTQKDVVRLLATGDGDVHAFGVLMTYVFSENTLPKELEELIRRCLTTAPGDVTQDMSNIAATLDALLSGAAPQRRKSSSLGAIIGLSVAAAALALGLYFADHSMAVVPRTMVENVEVQPTSAPVEQAQAPAVEAEEEPPPEERAEATAAPQPEREHKVAPRAPAPKPRVMRPAPVEIRAPAPAPEPSPPPSPSAPEPVRERAPPIKPTPKDPDAVLDPFE